MNKVPITALLITYNEEKNIADLLANLSFVDKIIIIDSFSTDATKKIALKNDKVTFIENPFDNYAEQRNFALKQAVNSWVLFLDADERVGDKLKTEIITTVNQNEVSNIYYINRRFYFKNKPIYFSGLNTDKNVRLFYNQDVYYKGRVHEKLYYKGKDKTLKNNLKHFSYINFMAYKNKMQNYGRLKAEEKFKTQQKVNPIKKIVHPLYTFVNKYIFRLGFLDGFKGIILCYLMAYSVFYRYKVLENLCKKAETN